MWRGPATNRILAGSDEPFDQQVERLMKERNISRDAAITLIYRAEKVAKGLSW
jgi:hypothetical protein